MKPAAYDAIKQSEDTQNLKTLRTLASYIWPKGRWDLKARVFGAMACLIAAKLIGVYIPFIYKYVVDELTTPDHPLLLPGALIVSYGLARMGVSLFGELRDFIFVRVSQHAQRTIALSTFKHLHQLSMRFHLDRQTGGLSRVIERGVRGIQFVMSFMLFNILPTILEIFLISAILAWTFNLTFALITFFSVVFYIYFTFAVTNWRLKFRRKMNQKDSEANTKAIDSLLNFETVKYFGNEVHEHQRFDVALAGYERAAVKSQKSLSLLNFGQAGIIAVGSVAAMYLAAKGVVGGSFTLGDFVLINTYLMQLFLPLNFLGFVYREVKQSLTDMDKMFELLEVHTEISDPPNASPLQIQNGKVTFDAVSFSYREEREILKNISFEIGAGETLAVVGPSGSGKSTLARLLFRFYDVPSGKILIDDQKIESVTQNSLRKSIGVVPQDTVLFNDTIEYNIRYGDPSATQEQVIEAAKMAQIHDFVMRLPDQYQAQVGERGLKLSGGEKQRVAIARTILKNPSILIFDEATSALDSHTEKEIQHSLKEVSKDRTTLVIAHRLSTIIHANQILVLKEGEIVERGTHEELLSQKGEYAQMWEKQQEADQYQRKLDECLDAS